VCDELVYAGGAHRTVDSGRVEVLADLGVFLYGTPPFSLDRLLLKVG
jgi:transposase